MMPPSVESSVVAYTKGSPCAAGLGVVGMRLEVVGSRESFEEDANVVPWVAIRAVSLAALFRASAPSILLLLDEVSARLLCPFGAIPPISRLLDSHGGICGWKRYLRFKFDS